MTMQIWLFIIFNNTRKSAGVTRQLTGAFAPDLIFPMAETLQSLGAEKAWLVHGSDGTDEISISGTTAVAALENGRIEARELHPEDAGLAPRKFAEILGGTPEENGKAFAALLEGHQSAYRDAVLLNAAAALMVADKANSLPQGVEMARESIDSGTAKSKLQALAKLTSEAA